MTPRRKKHIQRVSGGLFFLYLAVLIYFLFFADEYGRTPSVEMRYNLVPFVEIRRFLVYRKTLGFRAVFLNVYGNIIGFLPFGFFLPAMHQYFRRVYRTVSVSFLFSCGIELTQLVTRRGSCDVDDVILNTLGGLLGYLLFALSRRLARRTAPGQKDNGTPAEPG